MREKTTGTPNEISPQKQSSEYKDSMVDVRGSYRAYIIYCLFRDVRTDGGRRDTKYSQQLTSFVINFIYLSPENDEIATVKEMVNGKKEQQCREANKRIL